MAKEVEGDDVPVQRAEHVTSSTRWPSFVVFSQRIFDFTRACAMMYFLLNQTQALARDEKIKRFSRISDGALDSCSPLNNVVNYSCVSQLNKSTVQSANSGTGCRTAIIRSGIPRVLIVSA